jgi:hypothetical protein
VGSPEAGGRRVDCQHGDQRPGRGAHDHRRSSPCCQGQSCREPALEQAWDRRRDGGSRVGDRDDPNTTRIGGPRAGGQHRRQNPARGNGAGRHLRSGEISGTIDQPSWSSTGQELAWQRCTWRAACRALAPVRCWAGAARPRNAAPASDRLPVDPASSRGSEYPSPAMLVLTPEGCEYVRQRGNGYVALRRSAKEQTVIERRIASAYMPWRSRAATAIRRSLEAARRADGWAMCSPCQAT